jgi:SAM-dependent methyltransferase
VSPPALLRRLRFAGRPVLVVLTDLLLGVRALLFVGFAHVCPCCGWRLRTFTAGGTSFASRWHGYCPRCNSKARHRRVWLYLQSKTNLFTEDLHLFHVSPKYSLSRRLVRRKNLTYVSADLGYRANIGLRMDLAAVPLRSDSMDAAICVHVLEHVEDDRAAMAELHRVLKPGGWALISVPLRLDQPTYEDASIVTAAGREAAFGETTHLRYYGSDLCDRLRDAGFEVSVDWASDVPDAVRKRYGLLDDENIFLCTKPGGEDR